MEKENITLKQPEGRDRTICQPWTPASTNMDADRTNRQRKVDEGKGEPHKLFQSAGHHSADNNSMEGEQSTRSFISSWAKEIQLELERAAAVTIQPARRQAWSEIQKEIEKTVEGVGGEDRKIPENWFDCEEEHPQQTARRMEGQKPKVCKSVIVTSWFGDDSSTDDTDSGVH